jgi:hypothetical protein
MKKILLVLMALVAVFMTGCGGDGGGVPTALIRGVAVDSAGTALSGVTVTVGSASAVTDAGGIYELPVTPGANIKVSAAKSGYVSPFKIVAALDGQTVPVNFALRAVGLSENLTGMSAAAKTVTDPRGTVVVLPAGSVVDADGNAVNAASVAVTTSMPNDPGFTNTFPGFFIGNNAGVSTPIESFGFITVDITCGGQRCNLGAGKTADIAIPVAAGADPGTATIELWSLNETTGIWAYESLATRDATGSPVVYRATVSHFSTYNLDRPISNAIPFNVTVKDGAGAPVANAQVVFDSTNESGGGRWQGRAMTDATGKAHFPVVPPGNIAVQATAGSQVGDASSYTVVNGVGEVNITLYTAVTRSFTVVYLADAVEMPAAGSYVSVSSGGEGGSGHSYVSGITNASGGVALSLRSGMGFYNYNANVTVGTVSYALYGNASTVDAIPAKWILLPGSTGNGGTPLF